jgi:hypothetical protein
MALEMALKEKLHSFCRISRTRTSKRWSVFYTTKS